MSDRWIIIPGWEKFQHRDAARSVIPTWIKVYTELMAKDGFLDLSFHLRGVLFSLWLEYAASKRQLRDNTLRLTRQLGHRVSVRDLERLNHAGFIAFSASNPAGMPAGKDASLEEKREENNPVGRQAVLRYAAAEEFDEPGLPTGEELQQTENGPVPFAVLLERERAKLRESL